MVTRFIGKSKRPCVSSVGASSCTPKVHCTESKGLTRPTGSRGGRVAIGALTVHLCYPGGEPSEPASAKPGQNPPILRPPAPIPQLSESQWAAGSQIPRGPIRVRGHSREECSDSSGPLVTRDPRDARARTVGKTNAEEYARWSLSTSTQTSDDFESRTRVPGGGRGRSASAPTWGTAPPTAPDLALPSPQEIQHALSYDPSRIRT